MLRLPSREVLFVRILTYGDELIKNFIHSQKDIHRWADITCSCQETPWNSKIQMNRSNNKDVNGQC